MRRFLIIINLFLIVVVFCSSNTEEQAVSIKNINSFKRVYTEYLVSTINDTAKVTNRKALFDSILVRSDISIEEFKKSLFYLRSHPEEFDIVLTSMIDSLEQVAKSKLPVK